MRWKDCAGDADSNLLCLVQAPPALSMAALACTVSSPLITMSVTNKHSVVKPTEVKWDKFLNPTGSLAGLNDAPVLAVKNKWMDLV